MSTGTGVFIGDYEIRNWHTVSILELSRARKGLGQKQGPAPTSSSKSEKKTIVSNKRSRNVKGKTNNPKTRAVKGQRGFQARELSDEEKQFIVANASTMPVITLARTMHRGIKVVRDYMDAQGIEVKRGRRFAEPAALEPPRLADLVADAAPVPGDEAMDDPTPGAAAPVQTGPATEAVVQQAWKEMQERARELRERVIAVQDLPPVTLRPYSPPAIIFDGGLSELVRPQNVTVVARTVVKLVEAMNAIPGVRADFGFSYELTAGVRP